jgi:stage V sporulation protein S
MGAPAAEVEIEESTEETILRVRSNSSPQSLASVVAHAVYEQRTVMLRAIGAGAVNQGVKAIAIARGYVAPRGHDLSCRPGFATVRGHGDEDVSAITLLIVVQ